MADIWFKGPSTSHDRRGLVVERYQCYPRVPMGNISLGCRWSALCRAVVWTWWRRAEIPTVSLFAHGFYMAFYRNGAIVWIFFGSKIDQKESIPFRLVESNGLSTEELCIELKLISCLFEVMVSCSIVWGACGDGWFSVPISCWFSSWIPKVIRCSSGAPAGISTCTSCNHHMRLCSLLVSAIHLLYVHILSCSACSRCKCVISCFYIKVIDRVREWERYTGSHWYVSKCSCHGKLCFPRLHLCDARKWLAATTNHYHSLFTRSLLLTCRWLTAINHPRPLEWRSVCFQGLVLQCNQPSASVATLATFT